jgi:4-oxalocrotonate tautomerase
MPITYLSLKNGKPVEYRNAIHASIKDALIDTFALPDDDYSGVTLQLDPDEMYYDPQFFGLPRSDDTIFIHMSWNRRSPELKMRLYEKIADNLEASPGLSRADIMIVVTETAPENWWVHGRTIDQDTGLDTRITDAPAGSTVK